MKTSTIVAVLAVLIAILAGWYGTGLPPFGGSSQAGPIGTVCTADTVACSDGSYVGRTGPNCEFVCPGPVSGATSTPGVTPPPSGGQGIAPYRSGIRGTVMAGPTCPVERIPQDPACADKPLKTSIAIYRAGSAQVFATATSNAQGAFEISLPPGSYTLRAGGQTPPTCRPVSAAVGPDAYSRVSVECDTGIR